MKLLITAFVRKNEVEPLKNVFSLAVLKMAAKKSLEGLGKNIKSSLKIPGTRLEKIYLTSSGGAGRVIFLLELNVKKSVLVMIRLKNDKPIGANMTIKNPKFRKVLEKNLNAVLQDLERGDYEEYPL